MGVQRGVIDFLGSNIYWFDGEAKLFNKGGMDGIDFTS